LSAGDLQPTTQAQQQQPLSGVEVSWRAENPNLQTLSFPLYVDNPAVTTAAATAAATATATATASATATGKPPQQQQQQPQIRVVRRITQELKVTKRSMDGAAKPSFSSSVSASSAPPPVVVGWSEYSRLTTFPAYPAATAVPSVLAQRLLVRLKENHEEENQEKENQEKVESTGNSRGAVSVRSVSISGLLRLYVYPGDSLDFAGDQPLVSLKGRIKLSRIPSS
jgi:hypothetical protein